MNLGVVQNDYLEQVLRGIEQETPISLFVMTSLGCKSLDGLQQFRSLLGEESFSNVVRSVLRKLLEQSCQLQPDILDLAITLQKSSQGWTPIRSSALHSRLCECVGILGALIFSPRVTNAGGWPADATSEEARRLRRVAHNGILHLYLLLRNEEGAGRDVA